ncbi:AI-2E family transporter [Pseudomonas sp. v388]|uniref:AI-2E family transporter n=1 Tax=Pseudomonas sp. v388 TaxID=2479849 RepID=UPI000F7AF8EF|nr:AI-2E family transporter [Pseudomonas sp. v388]RRV04597.1 AI-2E family transporter [Pseudomonas sp. v388]
MLPQSSLSSRVSQDLLDVFIRAGLIAALVTVCYQVFRPFLELMVWAIILAVTLYPMQRWMLSRARIRAGLAATLVVALTLILLLLPTWLLAVSLTESVEALFTQIRSGSWHPPAPPDAVAGWPLIGPRLHALWLSASTDLTGTFHRLLPHLKGSGRAMLETAANLGAALLLFIGALIIAGICMAFADQGLDASQRIAARISRPERGPRIVTLCVSTIRAVALGVIGIAFIQMVLLGVGFVIMGVPGAGILAVAVLLLGIVQFPATLITLPVIIYVISTEGLVLPTIVFAVYSLIAGLADNVLKPLLLGRGVDVPMPVVLIGALGGMVVKGIIGLFLGPVILAVGYRIFWLWVDERAKKLPAGSGLEE